MVPKENPTGDVQYENRWFAGWPHTRVDEYTMASGEKFPFGGLIFSTETIGRFAIEICEDGWMGIRPGSFYALAGELIFCVILRHLGLSWKTSNLKTYGGASLT